MSELGVRAMSQEEFEVWRQQIASAFVAEQVASGNWRADRALQLALEGNADMLPQGRATPGMLLLRAVLADGTPVGRACLGLNHPRGTPDCAFIYDLEVDTAFRGRGLGRALLTALERTVRDHGIGTLELHVFGDNERAIALYAAGGYSVVTQQMRKRLLS